MEQEQQLMPEGGGEQKNRETPARYASVAGGKKQRNKKIIAAVIVVVILGVLVFLGATQGKKLRFVCEGILNGRLEKMRQGRVCQMPVLDGGKECRYGVDCQGGVCLPQPECMQECEPVGDDPVPTEYDCQKKCEGFCIKFKPACFIGLKVVDGDLRLEECVD